MKQAGTRLNTLYESQSVPEHTLIFHYRLVVRESAVSQDDKMTLRIACLFFDPREPAPQPWTYFRWIQEEKR